jgi:hypothetical protein
MYTCVFILKGIKYMKINRTTTIIREYDENTGNLIKETETIVEEEIKDTYNPTYTPSYPFTYPQITYLDNPNYKPFITCNCKLDGDNLCQNLK